MSQNIQTPDDNAKHLRPVVTKRFIEPNEIPDGAVLIDCRPKAQYLVGHLVGALHFEFLEKFIIRNSDQLEFFNLTLQNLVRGLGLQGDEHIVTYDSGRDSRASRVSWAFEYAGFVVQILRQGLSAQAPLETTIPQLSQSQFVLVPQQNVLATADQILAGGVLVIDTREPREFTGQKLAPGATRGGHIAGALNLDWQELADERGIKDPEALDKLFKNLPKQDIVVHCQSGARSSVVYHALRERGYTVRNYLGSMNEWAADETLPLETPIF
jgi:thiosulfate/3-mercaptopyruvate sulfurtransferase